MNAALRLSAAQSSGGSFEIDNVLDVAHLDKSAERTARDVLITMADRGHLVRRRCIIGDRESLWYTPDSRPGTDDEDGSDAE